jgi:predicted dehydrogenase
MEQTAKPSRIIIVGYGWRSLFYQRIAQALPDRFELVHWVLRTAERAAEVAARYRVKTTTDLSIALETPHDLVVLSVPASSVEPLLSSLIERNETILCETSFTPLPLQTLESLYARYLDSDSRLSVAEQYFRYPYFRSCHEAMHLLGPITGVRSACVHGHHGTSLIRHFLDARREDCIVRASRHTATVIKTGGRDCVDTKGTPVRSTRTVAVLEFGNERTGYFDFSDIQYHSCIRSGHFGLYGQRGEIVDDRVSFLDECNREAVQTFHRIEDGRKNNSPLSLRAVTLGSAYLFENPYWPKPFNDDEIAVALCMEASVSGQSYSFADALQDAYLAQCISKSCDTGMPVAATRRIWTDR